MPPETTAVQQETLNEPLTVSGVACGSSHSLALLSTGELVVSWGRGEDGQLGHGDAEERTTPQAVSGLTNRAISSVHCGAEYSVAISLERRETYSFGWGDFGRLGHGDCRDMFVPTPIPALSGIQVVTAACGDTHTLVLTDTGAVYSFGSNKAGQLGTGTDVDSPVPQLLKALEGKRVMSVACGAEHSLCCTDEGAVWSWGWGRYGNLGDGECSDRSLPVAVKGLEGMRAVSVACGWRHSAAIDDQGRLFVWGWSRWGQLGLGDCNDACIPRQVFVLSGCKVKLVAGGWRHTMAVDEDGGLWGWGWNRFGQLGLGSNEEVVEAPRRVEALVGEPVLRLASGWRHCLAVTAGGKVYSWGRGVNGQLGLGDSNDANVPTLVPGLSRGGISMEALSQAVQHAVLYSVPPADRYAVVPDNAAEEEAAVPDHKRQKL